MSAAEVSKVKSICRFIKGAVCKNYSPVMFIFLRNGGQHITTIDLLLPVAAALSCDHQGNVLVVHTVRTGALDRWDRAVFRRWTRRETS